MPDEPILETTPFGDYLRRKIEEKITTSKNQRYWLNKPYIARITRLK